jgi:hypothetical protein
VNVFDTYSSDSLRIVALKEILSGSDIFRNFTVNLKVNTSDDFTFFTDICNHYVLMNSVQHYYMSQHIVFVISL